MRRFNQRQFLWLNLLWFDLIWFIAVFFANQGLYLLVISLICHFYLTPCRRLDLLVMASITLIGGSADAVLSLTGVMLFTNGVLLPLWLLLLWTHFSLTLNHGMSWLLRLPLVVQVMVGALFGPLSYYIGAQMGAVIFPLPLLTTVIILAAVWICLLPIYLQIIVYLREKENGQSNRD